jgi:CubicO group peptidase (beta-lactamase class C family)
MVNDINMKTKRKKILIVTCSVIALLITWGVISYLIDVYRINRIPQTSFNDILSCVTENNKNAKITVGMIQNGQKSYVLYGDNGVELPSTEHIYEIGSITKTFTADLVLKAVTEGKINLDDQIDKYINLPPKDYYPTIKRLITHTSGYEGYYFEGRMLSNYLNERNVFQNISKEQLVKKIGEIDLKDQDYSFNYSNFGIAVIGEVISAVYNESFTTIMNNYVANELKLKNTHVSKGSGDLDNYWNWAEDDTYIPAGALISTMGDMLKYAQIQLDEKTECQFSAHHRLAEINANTEKSIKMNVHMDSVGAAWIIDKENNIIWHNGGTDNYSCYLGFDPDKKIAVIILTNLPSDYYIPSFATVMGVKLLTELQQN